MKEFFHQALVQASRARLYAVITDIERYPTFIDNCNHAVILEKHANPDGTENVEAEIGIRFGPLSKRISTKNVNHPEHKIEVSLSQGARSLDGYWELQATSENTTTVICKFTYSLGSSRLDGIAQMLLASLLDKTIASCIAHAEKNPS